ncbi:hypothetical protein QM407_02005 [Streptococcus parasanguinis]|uniref:hypothetical protein n=1 Tax=Streptococcus parasanguinis TaxID=1318 RepID=UPI0039C2E173
MSDKFKDYGVSTIIAIDDVFNDIKEEDKLEKFLPEVIDDLTGGQYDFFRDHTISEYIDEVGEDDFIEKLKSSLDQTEHYKCFQSDNIDFKKIGADYSQVERAINEIDATDKSRKHLILLDRTLQNPVAGLGRDDVFVNILKLIHSKLRKKNLLLLIYTDSDTPEELNSFEGAKEYLSNLGLDESVAEQLVLHFNYFQKTEELSADFFDNILKSQKANYISEYKNIFEESYSKLTERLWQLNQNQVLFYYDYINEGQHVDNIIYETFLTKFKQVYSDTFNEVNNHKELINPIRRSMQRSVQSIQDGEILRFLKNLDLATTFNDRLIKISSSTDISFGDVIQIGTKKFLLISQGCDTTIRDDGNRTLSNFQLVEIKEDIEPITEKSLHNKLKELNKKCEVYNNFTSKILEKHGIPRSIINNLFDPQSSKKHLGTEQIEELYFKHDFIEESKSKIYSIECIWLDALLLRQNEEGDIILSQENISNSHEIRYATQKYFDYKFKELITRIGEESSKEIVEKIIKFTFDELPIECEPIFSDDHKLIGFKLKNIQRIGRLDLLDAMKILKNIVEHESRIPITQILSI